MPLTFDRKNPRKDAELLPVPVALPSKINATAIVARDARGYAVPGVE